MEKLEIRKVAFAEIEALRALFLEENKFQIRFDAVHRRGWSDAYLLIWADKKIGYVSIKGFENTGDRDSIFEFFLLPEATEKAPDIFPLIIQTTGAKYIECQTNEPLLSAMQRRFLKSICTEALLFGNPFDAGLTAPKGCLFRQIETTDHPIFDHHSEPEGGYGVEKDGKIAATGGFLTHYNFPFADLFMEVRADCRQSGIGSYLIQELIKTCFAAGRVPAARCNPHNIASQKALLKGGFRQVGAVLSGSID
jgi:GNAT superfamily N-acetyltransferase